MPGHVRIPLESEHNNMDAFSNLYRDDFILAAGCIAHHKLNRFQLDPYQCTFLQWGLNKVCVKEDEPHGLLEQLMECHRHSRLT